MLVIRRVVKLVQRQGARETLIASNLFFSALMARVGIHTRAHVKLLALLVNARVQYGDEW